MATSWSLRTSSAPCAKLTDAFAGADQVIDRHHENTADLVLRATAGEGIDRIVDVDLPANLSINLKCAVQGTAAR